METIAFLGCSRGLGRAVCLSMHEKLPVDFSLLVARSQSSLESLSKELTTPNKILKLDLAKPDCLPQIMDELSANKVKRVFYFAAGGPHGLFAKKEWKDHLWSLQVSFLTPSELFHGILSRPELSCVEQIIFVGSLVADSKPDPLAASYASAKHGLRGLVESVQKEDLACDVRFFRPGYMNTDLLPKNALPRIQGTGLLEPAQVAKQFVDWALDEKAPKIIDISV